MAARAQRRTLAPHPRPFPLLRGVKDEVCRTIPSGHFLRVLDRSYQFVRMFNEDIEHRTGLRRVEDSTRSLARMRIHVLTYRHR